MGLFIIKMAIILSTYFKLFVVSLIFVGRVRVGYANPFGGLRQFPYMREFLGVSFRINDYPGKYIARLSLVMLVYKDVGMRLR